MKRYNKPAIVLISFLSLFAFSCEKFLDQAPAGEQTKEYIFEDYMRSQRYMDLLYYYLPALWETGTITGGSNYGFMESATDMAEYTASYGAANTSFNVGNWLATSASAEINRWSSSYSQIRRCFMFLENIDNFNNEPTDAKGVSRKRTMKGEVHFMIGFYYNELMKRYGGVPIVTDVLTLDTDFSIPRSTYEETKDYILMNLDSAISILPLVWPQNDFGRVTKVAAMALKSRILLYAASPQNNPANDAARWSLAANAARDVIDTCVAKGLHPLYHDYQNLFMRDYPEKRPEIIMPRHRGANTITFNYNVIRYGQATPGEGFQGYGSNSPTQNLVDRYEVIQYDGGGNPTGTEKFDWNNPAHVSNIYKNRDPRFYYTIIYNDLYWIKRKIETWRDGTNYGKDVNPKDHLFTRTGYYMRKFWPKECQSYQQIGSASLSSFYIRYGEVLLNYAEAMNEVYGPDNDGLGRTSSLTAREAVNQIRARLVCPSFASAPAASHPYYYVYQERLVNPDFPVLPAGLPPVPSGLTADQFRDKVRNERTVELAFEGHYWYDILRWKQGADRIGGTVYGVDVVKSGSTFTHSRKVVEQRYFDPARMYLYPIPNTEVYNMGISQNPGW
jgi:hypothetical protein